MEIVLNTSIRRILEKYVCGLKIRWQINLKDICITFIFMKHEEKHISLSKKIYYSVKRCKLFVHHAYSSWYKDVLISTKWSCISWICSTDWIHSLSIQILLYFQTTIIYNIWAIHSFCHNCMRDQTESHVYLHAHSFELLRKIEALYWWV